ncbi:MAG: glycosyltransferase [Clostridia bacterium]|nr:glycosyltransferase [Clostridia bacterium]
MTGLISVIVPAYNAEKTIEKCINSISCQSYENLEIIVINDGSKDTTEEIVSKLAEIDKRIKLITIPNVGVSHARNTGLEYVTGDFVTFVDADDTIESGMYEHLIELLRRYDADISHCSYSTIFPDGRVVPVGNVGKVIVQSKDEALDSLISGRYFAGGLCNKLYKSVLIKDIRLNEKIKINEDVLMNFEIFRNADKSVYSDKALYNYFQYDTSATHTANHLNSMKDSVFVSETIYNKSMGTSYESSAKKRMAFSKLGQFGTYSIHKGIISKEELNALKTEVKGYLSEGLYRRNDKIKFMMYSYCPWLYKAGYRIFDKIRVKKLDPVQ